MGPVEPREPLRLVQPGDLRDAFAGQKVDRLDRPVAELGDKQPAPLGIIGEMIDPLSDVGERDRLLEYQRRRLVRGRSLCTACAERRQCPEENMSRFMTILLALGPSLSRGTY